MKIATVPCLLTVLFVLSSCGQGLDLLGHSADPDDIAGYTPASDDLIGSPASSMYLTLPQPFPAPAVDSYEYFFNYRLEKFAPDTEPFIREAFGSTLGIKRASLWEHESYTSLAVGFAANLPSVSVIEYGETTAYGSHTVVSESYFYNHLHYIRGLKEGTTYHYRVFVKDDSGATIALPDRTLRTKSFTTEIKLYQEDFTHYSESIGDSTYAVPEPGPGVKTRPGLCIFAPGTYVLMEDISSDGLGINIKSHNVTIDLNGHTLTYDNGDNIFAAGEYDGQYNESGSWGIRAGLWNYENTKIYNGIIRQGLTGTANRGPLFLFHMGGNTRNEIAGLTIDYYSGQTSGMYVGRGYTHHNVIYDRGGIVTDRHMAVRALVADPASYTEVAYNSLRRFRQRGIDGGTLVRDNELYSDSFDTNSFALGVGDGATVRDNKVFGMGYNPIGTGWGNNIRVENNFIYLRGFAPTQRSDEYSRKSGIAGMRVTNYDNNVFENMLFLGNIIVLKPEEGCIQARGIWTTNGTQDRNIVYRNNTVKIEALPGNFDPSLGQHRGLFYNGDPNNAVAAVTVQGGGWTSEEIPSAVVFEDNHFISNVNHIILGEGYGIASGARFYRTTLEKIEHDSDHGYFAPVRLGFWYWNTLGNFMADTKFIGITEAEMIPHFYGGTGKMEIRYGERKALTFTDGNGRPVANKAVTLSAAEDAYKHTVQTDGNGRAVFDLPVVRHFQYGNSVEDGGVAGTPERLDYGEYIFSAEGYRPYTVAAAQWRSASRILLMHDD